MPIAEPGQRQAGLTLARARADGPRERLSYRPRQHSVRYSRSRDVEGGAVVARDVRDGKVT